MMKKSQVENAGAGGKIRVLVAEALPDLCRALATYINGKDDMIVVGCFQQGLDACQRIIELCPDVAVISIMLPVLDGLGILEKCKALKDLPTKFIIMSCIKEPVIMEECIKLGACYFMLKPVDMEALTKRIRLLANACRENISVMQNPINVSDSCGINHAIVRLLQDIGIPTHLNGYHYIKEAVILMLDNKDYSRQLTKIIYPELAKQFHSTGDRIERSIRSAITYAWSSGNKVFCHVFQSKPTNSRFLSHTTETIRLAKHGQSKD